MIGNCDNCERRNVPGSPGEASGAEGWFCYICRGHDDPDPYCEVNTPKRCETNIAGFRGECIDCGAWSGEACRNTAIELLREGERTMGNEARFHWKQRVGAYLAALSRF